MNYFWKIYIIGGNGVMGKLLKERINLFHPYRDIIVIYKDQKIEIPDGTNDKQNLVIVSVPIKEIYNVLKSIAFINPKYTHVTEIGSTKGMYLSYLEVMKKANEANPTIYFESFHPMVGPLATDWNILNWGKKCIKIIPNELCFLADMITDFWTILGFEIKEISYDRHDKIIGKLSHLSHLMILSYVNYIKKTCSDEEINLAGTSFKKFEEMAKGAERLSDIYETNKDLIVIVKEFSEFFNETSQVYNENFKL